MVYRKGNSRDGKISIEGHKISDHKVRIHESKTTKR
jgi:hypothetical protein